MYQPDSATVRVWKMVNLRMRQNYDASSYHEEL